MKTAKILIYVILVISFVYFNGCSPYAVTAVSSIASIASAQHSIDKMEQGARNTYFPAYVDSLKCNNKQIYIFGSITNNTGWTISGVKLTISYYDFGEDGTALFDKDDKYKLANSKHQLSITIEAHHQSSFVDSFYTYSESLYSRVCSGEKLTTFFNIDKVITTDGASKFDSGVLGY